MTSGNIFLSRCKYKEQLEKTCRRVLILLLRLYLEQLMPPVHFVLQCRSSEVLEIQWNVKSLPYEKENKAERIEYKMEIKI